MSKNEKEKPQATEKKSLQSSSPLVFISHDARDAKLAEVFRNYLKTHNLADNICVGLLKGYTDAKKT